MSNTRRFIGNTLWGLIRLPVTALVQLALIAYFLRTIGVELFGLWVLLQTFSVVGGLVSLTDFGLQDAVVRYLTSFRSSGNRDSYRRLLVSAFLVFTGLGLATAAALYAAVSWLTGSVFEIPIALQATAHEAFALYAISVAAGFPALILKAFFRSQEDFRHLELWEVLRSLSFACLAAMLIALKATLIMVVAADVTVMLVLPVLFALFCYRWYPDWFTLDPRIFSTASLRGIRTMSLLVFANRLLGVVYRRSPQILIGIFLSPAHVAAFAVSQRLPNAVKQVQGALNSALLPTAIRLLTENKQASIRYAILRGTRYSFVLFLPGLIYLFIHAEAVLSVWLGQEFAGYGPFLRAFLALQAMELLVSFGASACVVTRQFRLLLVPSLIVPLVFFSVTLGLGLESDIRPVIIGLAVSGAILFPWQLCIILTTNGIAFRDYINVVLLKPVLLFGTIAVAFSYLLAWAMPPNNLWLIIFEGFVLYGVQLVVLFLLGLMPEERKQLLKFGRTLGVSLRA